MTEQQSLLIKVLGKQLFGSREEITGFDRIDWDSFLTEARQQAVLSLVYTYVEDKMPRDDVYRKFHKMSSACSASGIRNLYYHHTLHKLLEGNNIPYVILKGQVSARYYPEPFLRDAGDVDFLVNREDVETVDMLLTKQGYIKSSKSNEHEFHWAYKKNKEILELHWDIPGLPQDHIGPENSETEQAENKTSVSFNVVSKKSILKNSKSRITGNEAVFKIREYVSDILIKRKLVVDPDGSYYIPSAFHHGIVLLLHTISHIPSAGIGLRHLCDWLVFENSFSEKDFLEMFCEPLKEMGIWTFAQVMTQIGLLYFGCEEREWCKDADSTLCLDFLEDILKGGNFGAKDMSRKSQVMLIQNKTTKNMSSGDVLLNMMTSINRRAMFDFPICKRIVVIRPFVWMVVMVQYVSRIRRGEKRSVIKKEVFADALRRKSIYAKLKLFKKQ